jgi:hypothetical protein
MFVDPGKVHRKRYPGRCFVDQDDAETVAELQVLVLHRLQFSEATSRYYTFHRKALTPDCKAICSMTAGVRRSSGRACLSPNP